MIVKGVDINKIVADKLLNSNRLADKKIILVSSTDNMSSMAYVKGIVNMGAKLNVVVDHINLSSDITNDEYVNEILRLNQSDYAGILLLTPVPKQIDFNYVSSYIDVNKDLDCLNVINNGNFYTNKVLYGPSTAKAVMKYIEVNSIDVCGKDVVIVGSSNIVGKPVAKLMLDLKATVTVCNKYTVNLEKFTKSADVIVMAAGVANLLTADMISDDAIIIDVGINFIDGKMCGDANFVSCSKKTSNITPVPGGVGVVTSLMLFENLYYLLGE